VKRIRAGTHLPHAGNRALLTDIALAHARGALVRLAVSEVHDNTATLYLYLQEHVAQQPLNRSSTKVDFV
jgi:hypothetical protein